MVPPGPQNGTKTHPWDTRGPKSALKWPQRASHEVQMSNQGLPGKPKGAQRHPKETQMASKIERNDPSGAKRAPRKNTKAKLQYYLVNNTIQEAKLQYYLVNNTIQKTVFYGFSWRLHYYLVNNTIQLTPKAANGAKNTQKHHAGRL